MKENIYLGLVHYPVYNRNNDIVATSVTNFDIHDISRTCRTYDIKNYFIITPVDAQIELTKRIIGYWQGGAGKTYNQKREEAFTRTQIAKSVDEVIEEVEKIKGKKVRIVTTSAKIFPNSISYKHLSEKMYNKNEDEVYLILFGTGWGLTDEIMNRSDYILEPIRGKVDYNHLSVRSAVAIILDRLFGEN